MVDVLVTRKSSVECRWYFRVTDGVLVGFDSSLGSEVDACEIRFMQQSDFQSRRFPSRIAVRYGDTEYGIFDLLSIETTASSESIK
jgi:hypothetical protein